LLPSQKKPSRIEFEAIKLLQIHEHSHIMGWDGHRGFSDHLTELLEQVILRRDRFDLLEQERRDIVSRVTFQKSAKSLFATNVAHSNCIGWRLRFCLAGMLSDLCVLQTFMHSLLEIMQVE